MILGILSDTHDRVARTERAVAALVAAKAEALIHCGDLTGPDIVQACSELPCHYVFGNNDFDEDALRRAMAGTGGVCLERGGEITLGGRRIAVTHGDSIREVNRLAYAGPDYLLYGHSHLFADDRRGGTRWINPGAL
ncbi:MAG TPA: metallophosphoesterase family protein, partial [Isosphaeraceae bacterium]